MMKKQNKKRGFTIVELTIVVSVIAILSAVLIPTFAGIIKRSKISSDEQAVRNMNTVIATIVEDDIDYNDIADALDEAGYNVLNKNDAWNPLYKDFSAYWLKDNNTIVLVEDGQVVYPAYLAGALPANAMALKASNYVATSNATTAEGAVADIENALSNGTSVALTTKMDEPIEVKSSLTISEGEEITVDLGGNAIKAAEEKKNGSGQSISYYAFRVDEGADLTIENGSIEARGVLNKGNLTIGEGTTIVATDADGGQAINNKAGATVTITGATLKVTGGDGFYETENDIYYEPQAVANNGGTIIIKDSTIINEGSVNYAVSNMSGTMEITNTTITSKRGGIHVTEGNVTINNCTVESQFTVSAHALYVKAGGNVTVNGGTFTVPASTGCYGIYKEAGATVTLNNSPVATKNW